MPHSGESVYVYGFEYYDEATGTWRRAPLPATMETITRNGWRVLEGTGKMVFGELVDSSGIAYRP